MEKFYHHWFASDQHMLGLIDELGWSDKVLFPRPYTVMYHEGQILPVRFDHQGASCSPGLGWGSTKSASGWWGCTCA